MVSLYIHTPLCKFSVYIIIVLLQMVDVFHSASLHLILNEVVHPTTHLLFWGWERGLSCCSQPGEAPACQFCPPQVSLRHLHLWWAFGAACEMTSPNCMEWSGHLLLVLIFSLPRIFMFSAQSRAQKKKQIPLFLGGQPTTLSLALLPLSPHGLSCFPECQSFPRGGDGDSRMAGDH